MIQRVTDRLAIAYSALSIGHDAMLSRALKNPEMYNFTVVIYL